MSARQIPDRRPHGSTALPAVVADALWGLLVVLAAGAAVLVAALPEPTRPVVVVAVVAVVAAAMAAVSGRRLAGTVALALVTLAVLLASALDASDLRPVQVVAAAVLVLVVATALDHVERADRGGVTVLRASTASRLTPPALAVGAAALVSVTAAQHVVPSVRLVLVGLAAAVAALVVASRAHRN